MTTLTGAGGLSRGRIVPGETVLDDRGRVAQLHGVGVMRWGDRFWAWGEDKTTGFGFTSIAAYSSPDFAAWTFEGDALSSTPGGVLAPGRIVERPKVLFNASTHTFVMFIHLDDAEYSDACLGIATSRGPAGPFTLLSHGRPLGYLSRDIGVYEEDGTGYLLSEDRENGLTIYRLSADYTAVRDRIVTLQQANASHGYESPALIRHDGIYYLFGSDLTGWSHNDNKYSTAASLWGPWADWRDVAPRGTATFDSQVSAVIEVATATGTCHVYVGDRWAPSDLANSGLVVLPLALDAGVARLEWRDDWSLADLE